MAQDGSPFYPYNEFVSDTKKNMVVPGLWFGWVNNGLGRMEIVEDEAFGTQRVEIKPNGSVILHLASSGASISAGWFCSPGVNNTLVINTQSIAIVNQKTFYLSTYVSPPVVGAEISYYSISYDGFSKLYVWLEVSLDPSGGDGHTLEVKSGTTLPVPTANVTPLIIIRPICEITDSGGSYNFVQHALGLITVDTP